MWVILPAAFFLYAIYLTHSRGAVVGLSAMILLTLRKRLGSVRTFALVGVLVVAAAVTNLAGSRAYSVNEASAGGRIEVWSVGLEMFRAHPLFGVGYGNFVENSAEYGLTAHNSFVLCLAELGLIGCFFWLALIVATARELQAAERAPSAGEPEGLHKLIVALKASLVGFLVCALFLSRAYAPHLYLLLGLCSAASFCTFENEEVAPRSAGWIPQSAGALAGGIVVIYLAIRLKHALG
jgi:putative inorganic carbon (HCO3(-)) transporter